MSVKIKNVNIIESKYGFRARKSYDCSSENWDAEKHAYKHGVITDYWYGEGGAMIVLPDGTIKEIKQSWDGKDGYTMFYTMVLNGDIVQEYV
jgi:hypothetical protein